MSSIVGGVGRIASSGWAFLQRATASAFHSPLLGSLNQVKNSVNPLARNYPDKLPVSPGQFWTDTNSFERCTVLESVTKEKVTRKNEDLYLSHYINNVTETPSFEQGLAGDTRKASSFHAREKTDDLATFRYIANNTNPNYLLGIFRNIFRFFSTGTLNQNCVFCSKAVDKNLAALEQGQMETFWVARSTGRGALPQNVREDNYSTFVMRPEQPLSRQLLTSTREGSRNIIMVPVKNRHFSHAMNLVRTESGHFVIDGQSGRVYDLSSTEGRLNFDKRYGRNHGLNLVQIYHSGSAPVTGQMPSAKPASM